MGTGLGIANGSSGPPRQQQPQPQVPPRWSFLLKLEVLRSISPPLKPSGPGGPVLETRGPLIAIEGAAPSLLKEVASVVEKALAVSGEYAVKTWTDETQTPRPSTGDTTEKESNASESQLESKETTAVKKPGFTSPLAVYIGRMLRWHKTSEELRKYITSYPAPPTTEDTEMGEGDKAAEDASSLKPNPRLPVAVVADGYSLTVSDRYASSLHVNDAYRADDHWQWVATLWRGIVGADLTIYVKRAGEAEVQGNNCVEFANAAVVVLRVAEGKGVDEKLERRLGFEIIEWVRSGSFKAGFAGAPRSS